MTSKYLKSVLLVTAMAGALVTESHILQAQSLEEALSEAYQGNPTLQAQRAGLRALDESLPQSKAGWRPTISLTGDINGVRDRTRTRTSRIDSTRITSGLDIQITQNVYDSGATSAAVEGTKADILAARSNLIATEQTILLQAATAYMDVYQNEAVLALNEQNLTRLERQLEATRDQFNAGVATLTDVAQAESRLSRSRSDLLSAKGTLDVSRSAFEKVIGFPPRNIRLPDMVLNIPSGKEAAKEMAIEQDPSVRSAVYARRAALYAIEEEFADLLPQVTVTGTAGYDFDRVSKDSRERNLQISAQVTVPIYQRGFEASQVRQSKKTAAQRALEIEEAYREAAERASSAWESYQSIVSAIVAIKQEVRAAEVALEGVQQEELVGQRTVLDVLDAEQELLDAKVSLVQAERNETVARFTLVSATGSLTAKDLGLDVDLYNPGIHFEKTQDRLWGLGEPVPPHELDGDTLK